MKNVWLAILGITIIAASYYSEELRSYINSPKPQPPAKSVPNPVFFSEIQPNYLQIYVPNAAATPPPTPTLPPRTVYIDASDLNIDDFDPINTKDPRKIGNGWVVKLKQDEYLSVRFDAAQCNKSRAIMRVDTDEQIKYCINMEGNYYCGDKMSELHDVSDTIGKGVTELSIHSLSDIRDTVRVFIHCYCF